MTPFEYLQKNARYIEHGEGKSDFWPHKCFWGNDEFSQCAYYIKDSLGTEVCELDCFRYRDLSLADYTALRMKEEGVNQSPCQCSTDCQECVCDECPK